MGGTEGIEKAIEYAELSLKTSTKKTENYVTTANLLIICYSQTGQLDKAEKLSKDIFKLGRKVFGVKNTKYAQILSNHSLQLARL
jgi:pentatricopeptide repeat protein